MEEMILFLFHAGHEPNRIWLKIKEVYPDVKLPHDFIIKILRKKGNADTYVHSVHKLRIIAKEDFSKFPADPSWRLWKKKGILPGGDTVGSYKFDRNNTSENNTSENNTPFEK